MFHKILIIAATTLEGLFWSFVDKILQKENQQYNKLLIKLVINSVMSTVKEHNKQIQNTLKLIIMAGQHW